MFPAAAALQVDSSLLSHHESPFVVKIINSLPVVWPPDAKSWLFNKDSNAGKDRGQEEKGVKEGEMV